jgi:hypothetical protein
MNHADIYQVGEREREREGGCTYQTGNCTNRSSSDERQNIHGYQIEFMTNTEHLLDTRVHRVVNR